MLPQLKTTFRWTLRWGIFLSLIFFPLALSSSLLRLPVPWLLYSVFHGLAPVAVSSNGLFCAIVLLFIMLLFVIISIASCKWKMNKALGFTMFLLYFIFLVLSVMLEDRIIICPVSIWTAGILFLWAAAWISVETVQKTNVVALTCCQWQESGMSVAMHIQHFLELVTMLAFIFFLITQKDAKLRSKI